MKTYKVKFYGREKGAIGIRYIIETTVQGKNIEEATLNLYDRYEHISILEMVEI